MENSHSYLICKNHNFRIKAIFLDVGREEAPGGGEKAKEQKNESENEKIEKALVDLKYQQRVFNQHLAELEAQKKEPPVKEFMLTYSIIKAKFKRPKEEPDLRDYSPRELIEFEVMTMKHLNHVCENALEKPLKIKDLKLTYVKPEDILSALKYMRKAFVYDPSFYDRMEMSGNAMVYKLASLTKDYLSEDELHKICREFTDGKGSLKERKKKLIEDLSAAIKRKDINEEDKKYILKEIRDWK